MFSPIKGHPAACKQQFEDKDPRSKVALSELDPRIHFALNCGARSCPPIRVYTEEKYDMTFCSCFQFKCVLLGLKIN